MKESECQSLSYVCYFETPQTVAPQAPLSMEISRQEYWSGLPFPSPGIFPNQGLNLGLRHCRQILCHLHHQIGVLAFLILLSQKREYTVIVYSLPEYEVVTISCYGSWHCKIYLFIYFTLAGRKIVCITCSLIR